ncbi:MAG: hypothetical protein A2507_02210 [Candidatus Magasanikbacteria bacterium RIFOXYD12_FULL_33_17]|nr:MAG: hypothetical protein A2507_02210 [Candidatus Magasanikbacteria bacterium RIFOXYD12_FULL_33_17]
MSEIINEEQEKFVRYFEFEFENLFKEWKLEWNSVGNGPTNEALYIEKIDPNFHDVDRKEFGARDKLIENAAKMICEGKKMGIDQIIVKGLPRLIRSSYGKSGIMLDFIPTLIAKIFAKTLELMDNNKK